LLFVIRNRAPASWLSETRIVPSVVQMSQNHCG